MVSLRCIVLVKDELNKLGIPFTDLELGSVVLLENLTDATREKLGKNLAESGLELQLDQKGILVEKIKHALLHWIDAQDDTPVNYSRYLTNSLNYRYNYLSNIFTEVEGMSIQTFMIKQKVELVKQLIEQGNLNLSEIAYRLHYSSSAHLSNQFKSVTGVSPTFFRNLRSRRR